MAEEVRSAAQRRFTVEGDPNDVFALAEQQGWKITRPRWWQRTYAIPRWLAWFAVAWWVLALPRNIEIVVGWLT